MRLDDASRFVLYFDLDGLLVRLEILEFTGLGLMN